MLQEIVVFLTVLANFFIAFVVYRNNPRSATHILLSLLSISLALWTFFNYLALLPGTESTRLLWVRVVMLVTTPFGPLIFLLATAFPETRLHVNKRVFRIQLILGILTAVFSLSPFMFVRLTNLSDGNFSLEPGPAILLFAITFFTFMSWGFIKLVRKYRRSSGIEKKQLGLFFFGLVTSFTLMTLTNFVAVIVFKSISLTSLGPPSTLIMVGFMAYAIIKHRFLDIRLVLARTVSYTLLSIIIITFYTASLYIVGNLILPTALNNNQMIISVMLSLVVAYTFQPLKGFLEKVTDNIFYQENYDPEELLRTVSPIIGSTLDIETLAKDVFRHMVPTLHLEYAGLLLFKGKRIDTILGYRWNGRKLLLSRKHLDILVSPKRNLILFDDLKEGSLKQMMRESQIGCFAKLRAKGSVVGILTLGNKLSGDTYSNNDIKVLEILAPQLAISIQNAIQYSEIQQFSKKLEREVEEATEKLRKANLNLKELDKLKNEFLSVAAHEMRAPLTAIRGYLSMVLEGDAGKVSKQVREFLQGALEGADREVRLVNNMLNVSRIEEGRLTYQMGKVNLGQIVVTAYDEFKLAAQQKGLTFEFEKPDTELKDTVYVDQDRIHEVVTNFISNAIKYTDAGSVKISLFQLARDRIRFEIADTGYGMSETEQKKLFQKFFRAESSAGKVLGTGLGLYITKLLIEKFDGKLGVESELGKGSTFWFELPVVHPKIDNYSKHDRVGSTYGKSTYLNR